MRTKLEEAAIHLDAVVSRVSTYLQQHMDIDAAGPALLDDACAAEALLEELSNGWGILERALLWSQCSVCGGQGKVYKDPTASGYMLGEKSQVVACPKCSVGVSIEEQIKSMLTDKNAMLEALEKRFGKKP